MAVATEEDYADPVSLYREFKRYFPRAEVEDYYKDGRWMVEMLRVDLELVKAHRREAYAPDPVPIEEIPEPVLPSRPASARTGGLPSSISRSSASPGRARARSAPAATRTGAPRSEPLRPAVGARRAGSPGLAAITRPLPLNSGSELRAVEDFLSRWNFNNVRAKMLLARISPADRKLVLANFRHTGGVESSTSALERYIAQMEQSNGRSTAKRPSAPAAASSATNGARSSWSAPSSTASSRSSLPTRSTAPSLATPLGKRPLEAPGSTYGQQDGYKRPKLGAAAIGARAQAASSGSLANTPWRSSSGSIAPLSRSSTTPSSSLMRSTLTSRLGTSSKPFSALAPERNGNGREATNPLDLPPPRPLGRPLSSAAKTASVPASAPGSAAATKPIAARGSASAAPAAPLVRKPDGGTFKAEKPGDLIRALLG